MIIDIYEEDGKKSDEFEIDDDLEYTGGRVWRSKLNREFYYKGAGAVYTHHFSFDEKLPRIEKHFSPYHGWKVINEAFVGKTGIFKDRYQPPFKCCIGGAGPREHRLVNTWDKFQYSGVIYYDSMITVPLPWDNRIYLLEYKGGRGKFIKFPNLSKLEDLLRYMITNDWNWAWDKKVLLDVNLEGLVTDIADVWKSDKYEHKFGTVYAALYHLWNDMPELAAKFCMRFGSKLSGLEDLLHAVRGILFSLGYYIEMPRGADRDMAYHHLALNVLMEGRTCACCETPDSYWGTYAKDEFKKRYINHFELEEGYGERLQDML